MWTSPLLFTVSEYKCTMPTAASERLCSFAVCACAARHYGRRGLWSLTMDIARDAASDALIMGPANVETVQALLILAVYPVPKKKWLEDKSWLFMGAAIRCDMRKRYL
jgi:transcriptional regulatory protein LEU3